MPKILNPNNRKVAIVSSSNMAWESSPASGVERKYLERDSSDEVARASTIVRFAPGSAFPKHIHAKGEEFIVLEGTFSDETGDFPTASYVRNPPGSSHSPHSKDGCTILVKLRQMEDSETARTFVKMDQGEWVPGEQTGVERKELFRSDTNSEIVTVERWQVDVRLEAPPEGGEEIFLLEGTLSLNGIVYPSGTWIRLPHLQKRTLKVVETSLLWIKRGHLDH